MAADLEQRIRAIEERNDRVTWDKAWEVSWTRRGTISVIIYGAAYILLNILGHDGAWKHASVPVIAYLISTFSLPPIKALWIRHVSKREGMKNVTIH